MTASGAVQNKQINPKPSGCDCGGCASSAGAGPGKGLVGATTWPHMAKQNLKCSTFHPSDNTIV